MALLLSLMVLSVMDEAMRVVFVTGNPGVTERDPYPTRTKPQPVIQVGVSAGRGRGSGGFFLMLRVHGYQY